MQDLLLLLILVCCCVITTRTMSTQVSDWSNTSDSAVFLADEDSADSPEQINFIITRRFLPTPNTHVDEPSSHVIKSTTSNNSTDVTSTTPPSDVPEDSEDFNNDKVEEVQFFAAPLVAAFTVHQDELGLPHSVVPLYKDTNHLGTSQPSPRKPIFDPVLASSRQEPATSLLERQKILEEQLYRLRQEQQRQEEKRRQQVEQQRLQEDYTRRHLLKLQQPRHKQPTFVSVLPSVSIAQPQFLVQQQLPTREAVDFLANLRQQNVPEFPLEQNHIPLNLNQALHQVHIAASVSPDSGRQSNRVFRNHDSQTGNFGTNSVAHVRRRQPDNFNRQLQSLLYENGLVSGSREEDLNIVSKVLSLNHLGRALHHPFI